MERSHHRDRVAGDDTRDIRQRQDPAPAHARRRRPSRVPGHMTTPFAPRCLLVTGGAGFIGSNFVRWLLKTDPNVQIVNLDLLTYAGNLESLSDVIGNGRHSFVHGDVRDFGTVRAVLAGERTPAPDAVVHMAAESHVDRSIMGPAEFVDTNVRGTLTLLEACPGELGRAP